MRLLITALALAVIPPLRAQQVDTTSVPLLRPGQRITSAWTTTTPTDSNGIRVARYLYLGTRDEQFSITLNAGFGGILTLVAESGGESTVIAATDSLRPVSTLEVKLPLDGRYWIFAGARRPGSYTLLALSQGSASGLDWATLYPGGGNPDERYALLVGVNDYPGTEHDLGGGPLVDVDLMRDLLMTRYGFLDRNILVLRDVEGNRDQVVEAFRRHLGQAGPRGAAVFYYSGHGMQIPHLPPGQGSPDPEADGQDEALALWGTQANLYGYLLDDELGVLVDELKTDRVLLILDHCHSGTSTRGGRDLSWSALFASPHPPPAVLASHAGRFPAVMHDKRIPSRDLAGKLQRPLARLSPGPLPRRSPLVLGASHDSELSLGVSLNMPDGSTVPVGLFTVLLTETLRVAPPTITFQQLYNALTPVVSEKAVQVSGKPQTPQLSGPQPGRRIDRFLAPAP